MKIQRLLVTPAQLASIPDSERALLVLVAHMLNEINTLHKLLVCAAKIEPGPHWHVHTGNSQAFIFCRILAGKLNEAWAALQQGFFGSKLSASYASSLSSPATAGLNELKKYFSKSNLINSVRNEFSFHYSIESAKASTPPDTNPEELALYVHKHVANSLYQFAEFIMNKALVDSIAPADVGRAMDRLLSEIDFVIKQFNEFGQGMMMMFLNQFIGEASLRQTTLELEIPNPPKLSEVRIPFFIEMPEPDVPRDA